MIIPYTHAENKIKENLIFDTKGMLNCFRLNSLKANPGKYIY